jgi:hypothetical protein
MGWNFYGLRHRPAGINQGGIHRDIGHSRPINQDGDLPSLPKGYRLTGIGMCVF